MGDRVYLRFSCKQPSLEIARILLEHDKESINVVEGYLGSVLQSAAGTPDEWMVKFLVQSRLSGRHGTG